MITRTIHRRYLLNFWLKKAPKAAPISRENRTKGIETGPTRPLPKLLDAPKALEWPRWDANCADIGELRSVRAKDMRIAKYVRILRFIPELLFRGGSGVK
jgi:hypothetical protein